jgi:Leishmanolysin
MSTTNPESVEATAAVASDFTIDVHFLGGLTASQQQAFTTAADCWEDVIVGDLPDVLVGGELVDDIVILAQGAEIDGPGSFLGQAGPTELRPADMGALPYMGEMTFDTADLADMEAQGTLTDVIIHEMGHALGIGTLWSANSLVVGGGTDHPLYIGPNAAAEYGQLRGHGIPQAVPLENTGGPGTRDGHWSEEVFDNELMTGLIVAAGNPLSRLTVASLQDLGYTVNLDAAEPYPVAPVHEPLVADATSQHAEPVLASIPVSLSTDDFLL